MTRNVKLFGINSTCHKFLIPYLNQMEIKQLWRWMAKLCLRWLWYAERKVWSFDTVLFANVQSCHFFWMLYELKLLWLTSSSDGIRSKLSETNNFTVEKKMQHSKFLLSHPEMFRFIIITGQSLVLKTGTMMIVYFSAEWSNYFQEPDLCNKHI